MLSIIAHRGFAGVRNENTMSAFEYSTTQKIAGIELDIHQTKDNNIVVIHDFRIDRTSNGKGIIGAMTLKELKKYKIGSKFDTPSLETIPTLEEVIDKFAGKTHLYIEVKKGKKYYPEMEKRILSIIHSLNARENCTLHSFQSHILYNISKLDPEYPIMLTRDCYSELKIHPDVFLNSTLMRLPGMCGLNLNIKHLNVKVVDKIKKKNLKILCWTGRSIADFKQAEKLGIDSIISDFPFFST